MKKYKKSMVLALAVLLVTVIVGCKSSATDQTTKTEETEVDHSKMDHSKGADTPDSAAGFEEFDIGDPVEKGPLHIAAVYFQPVDMQPAGNSLPKEESDAHIEADITANTKGAEELGYGKDEFVPGLTVKAIVQKEGSDKVQEVAFMPMNASDGPHYGSNIKFEDGLGTYKVKFVVSPPGNEYLLHTDKETGVSGEFWTTPIEVEWTFDWEGPQW